jgi:hypothetical protein
MMIDIASSVLGVMGIVVFSAWFLLTIAFQKNNKLSRLTTRFDRFTLIPRWSFFTPDPGASNYHFVYRSRDDKTGASPWLELNLSPRGIFYPLWNPRKRYREGMIELFHLLALFSRNNSASDSKVHRRHRGFTSLRWLKRAVQAKQLCHLSVFVR